MEGSGLMGKEHIRTWQKALAARQLPVGPADGDFGPKTLRASEMIFDGKNPWLDEVSVAAVTDTSEGVSSEAMPPWMEEMAQHFGKHEVRDNAELSEWLKGGKYLGDPAKLPWCGDGVETSFARRLPGEKLPDNPFWAQAWDNFGVKVDPMVGAVGVIRWSANAGHVGFVAEVTPSRIKLLGANQSNEIKLAWFPRSKFIAYRWPASYPIKTYPPLTQKAVEASMSETR